MKKTQSLVGQSFARIKGGTVDRASDDGMKLLGYFLLECVGQNIGSLDKWLQQGDEDQVCAKVYSIQRDGGTILLEHLDVPRMATLKTTKEAFHDILAQWHNVGKRGFKQLLIRRSKDTFDFEVEN